MHSGLNFFCEGIAFPCKEGAKGEVLDYGKFGKHLSVVHFQHALFRISKAFGTHALDWLHRPC